jgi:hypothetical protein
MNSNNTRTAQTQTAQTQAQAWQTSAGIEAQKKADLRAVRKVMRVCVLHRSPLEAVISTADFYGLITSALSVSKTGAIKARFAGMKGSAIIRSEAIASDVVRRFYESAKKERALISCAILTEKGVKLDAYAFEFLPATDAEVKEADEAKQ